MIRICHIDDLPERDARGFEVEGQKLLIIKKKGVVHLYRNSCPHTGINLDWQPDDFMSFDKFYIQCSTHGAQFQIEDGFCVLGPCKGQALKTVPFQVIDGEVVLNLQSLAPD